MKQILSIIYFSIITSVCHSQSQSAFDKALGEISSDISDKLLTLDKKKIVVLYVTDIDKQMTSAGKYLADIVSVNIVNNPGKFSVFDRSNLNEITEVKKLYSEGYIDATKAQELRRILGVDAIIVGNYTILSNTIKLTLKALDSDNGFVITASMKDLPLDGDAGALLGITIVSNESNSTGYGTASGEATGRTSRSSNCKEKNTGDFCFQNDTKFELSMQFSADYSSTRKYYAQRITIQPGQKQCFYDLPAGAFVYDIRKLNVNNRTFSAGSSSNSGGEKTYQAKGNVYVEVCKENKFVIR